MSGSVHLKPTLLNKLLENILSFNENGYHQTHTKTFFKDSAPSQIYLYWISEKLKMQTLRHLLYIYVICQCHYYFIGKCLVSDFAWILLFREAQKDLFIFNLSISCLYSDLVLERGIEAGSQMTGPIWLWELFGQREWYPIADGSTPLHLCVWDGRSCVFRVGKHAGNVLERSSFTWERETG